MKYSATLAGILLVSLTLAVPAQVQNAEVLMGTGLRQEEVQGNCTEAIKTYQKVVEDKSAPKPVAARAQLHIAACQEKLGLSDARASYELVLSKYADQVELAAQAQARLTGLGGLREERLWGGPTTETYGRPFHDGRYFTYVDWSTGFGNLGVRDLRTGQKRLVTRDANRQGWVEDPLPSVDGKRIAYRFADRQIRVIDTDGKNMKLVLRDNYDHLLKAWSPDNKYILATNFKEDRTFTIVLFSTADGTVRPLKSTGMGNPDVGGYSPDGRFLVYATNNDPKDGEGGVFALAADGSRQYRLVEGSRQAATTFGTPLWSPDGGRVIFMSNRSGAQGMWSVQVADGRPVGEPVAVRVTAGGMDPRGLTRDGALYYEKRENLFEAYTAEIDAAAMKIQNPIPITDQGVGNNRSPEVSPDGTSVAFVRRRMGMPLAIVVRKLERDAEERIVGTIPRGGAYAARVLQWFPDGRSLLVFTRGDGERKQFVRVDVKSGEEKVVFDAPWNVWMGALAADGESLFYSTTEEGLLRVVRRRLDSGSETELFRSKSLGGTDLFGLVASPDGSSLAFTRNVENNRRILCVLSTDGGTPREVYRSGPGGFWPAAIQWMPDSRTLMVSGNDVGRDDSVGETLRMYAIPAAGGSPRPFVTNVEGITNWSFSPDGKRIVYGSQRLTGELWVIRNLLADLAKAR